MKWLALAVLVCMDLYLFYITYSIYNSGYWHSLTPFFGLGAIVCTLGTIAAYYEAKD